MTQQRATTTGRLREGEDFYWERGLMVLTAHFLRKRGYCCDNGCRHCPYREGEATQRDKVDQTKSEYSNRR